MQAERDGEEELPAGWERASRRSGTRSVSWLTQASGSVVRPHVLDLALHYAGGVRRRRRGPAGGVGGVSAAVPGCAGPRPRLAWPGVHRHQEAVQKDEKAEAAAQTTDVEVGGQTSGQTGGGGPETKGRGVTDKLPGSTHCTCAGCAELTCIWLARYDESASKHCNDGALIHRRRIKLSSSYPEFTCFSSCVRRISCRHSRQHSGNGK